MFDKYELGYLEEKGYTAESAKKKAIEILSKYRFNEKLLARYHDADRDEMMAVETEIILDLVLHDGEKLILEYMKLDGLKDLSEEKDASGLEFYMTFEESGM